MDLTPVFASALAADVPTEVFGKVFMVCFLAVTLVAVLAFSLRTLWLIFEKAGIEGWKAMIPVYHHVLITRLAGLSAWWTLPLLLVLPFLKAHDKGAKLLCLAFDFGEGLFEFEVVHVALRKERHPIWPEAGQDATRTVFVRSAGGGP